MRNQASKLLTLLVGAARFELATPCAQGRFKAFGLHSCFHALTFQADPTTLVNSVEPGGTRRLRQLQNRLQYGGAELLFPQLLGRVNYIARAYANDNASWALHLADVECFSATTRESL